MKTGSVYGMGMLGTNEGVESDKKRCALSVIQLGTTFASKGQHPTEKPIELYKFLIERYSKEGDVVLDCTFGSGNSGHASIQLNRKYIGIEKDTNYFWKMIKSINLLD
jgi:site-specific DNA-methyltransferase (adenine-specific)